MPTYMSYLNWDQHEEIVTYEYVLFLFSNDKISMCPSTRFKEMKNVNNMYIVQKLWRIKKYIHVPYPFFSQYIYFNCIRYLIFPAVVSNRQFFSQSMYILKHHNMLLCSNCQRIVSVIYINVFFLNNVGYVNVTVLLYLFQNTPVFLWTGHIFLCIKINKVSFNLHIRQLS